MSLDDKLYEIKKKTGITLPKTIDENLINDAWNGYWQDQELENIAAGRLPWEWEKDDLKRLKNIDLLDLIDRYIQMDLPLGLSDEFLLEIMIFEKKLDTPRDKDLRLLAEHVSDFFRTADMWGLRAVSKVIGSQYEEKLREKGMEVVKDIEKAILKLRSYKASDKERLRYIRENKF